MHKNEGRCPLCHGYTSISTTTFTVDLGFGIVVVRHVPATVCEQCSAEWISDENAEKLEKIVSDAKVKHSMVEVSEFSSIFEEAS